MGLFDTSKPQNIPSFLMQATGDAVPEEQRCKRCCISGGIYRGTSVVVRDPDVLEWTGGACACCWYGRQGSLCTIRLPLHSFRNKTGKPGTQKWSRRPPTNGVPHPAPAGPNQVPKSEEQFPAAAPLHPSYAAALASSKVLVAPTSDRFQNNETPRLTNVSHDENVRVWEDCYRNMSLNEVVAANEHLVEWQVDLTARLVAMNRVVMNRVVMNRLREREGGV